MELLNFRPFPLLNHQFLQTTIGSFISFHKEPPSKTHLIELPDQDKIALEITTPKDWKIGDLIVVMVHGLCGSHKSSYMVRMAKRLSKMKVKAVRMNLRGCGSGRGHAKKIYLSESSEDILQVLKKLKAEHPNSPIILIGFSLGGNISLKLAGELQEKAKDFIEEIIAISPPINLEKSAILLGRPENRFYEKYLVDILVKDVHFRHSYFPDLPKVMISKEISMFEFDEVYLAPFAGFLSVREYYFACSSISLISQIRIPCKILFALDDPIIEATQLDNVILPPNILVYKSTGGGHMGFLSTPNKTTGVRWLDGILLSWIFKVRIF